MEPESGHASASGAGLAVDAGVAVVVGVGVGVALDWAQKPAATIQGSKRRSRPTRSFRSQSKLPCVRLGRMHCNWVGAGSCPTIHAGIVSPAGIQIGAATNAAPDDHFTTRPHCRVGATAFRHVRATSSCPVVRVGIVSAAGVQTEGIGLAPDDHFTARSTLRCGKLGRRSH